MAEFGGNQFREEAIVRSAHMEPLDERAELTAPREWAVLACLGLVLAAIVIWGAFGSVERTLRSDGVLVLSGERRTVPSAFSGTVAEVSASEGDRVAAGQPILLIVPHASERSVGLSAAAVRVLEDAAENATGADAKRLRASARALLDELASPRKPIPLPSPGDGVIAAILAAPGDTVARGSAVAELVSGDGNWTDAAAFVPRKVSWPLSEGMVARVTVETPEGRRSFPAELTSVAPRPADPPGWLARMLPGVAAQGRGHVLRLKISDSLTGQSAFGDGSAQSLGDGTPCRIEIVLGRTSPIALLIRR